MPAILLIEDDVPLAELIGDYLAQHHYRVQICVTAASALSVVRDFRPDLVLCDVNLPDMPGFELLGKLRLAPEVPCLFLTSLSDKASQLQGFTLGAADYIIKPVDPDILLARIRAHLRQGAEPQQLQLGELQLDKQLLQARFVGQLIDLTAHEFELLWYFVSQGSGTISREKLFLELLERPYDGKDRAADLRISRLRKKLSLQGLDELDIVSVRNQGYLFTYWAKV